MSMKTKAQLLAENEALQKRMAELLAEQPESHQKNDIYKKQAHTLNKRVKELNCLHGISRLVKTTGISLPEILQGSVELIPTAWQYPQITCARIMHEDQEYKTENFYESKCKLATEIIVSGERVGSIEVFYLEKRPKEDEGPFLMEERALIDALAERFGSIILLVLAKEREKHLNQVLRAIRNVNQLIISEKNPDLLIQKACDIFIGTRGFYTAWIALVDASGKFLTAAESGLSKGFAPFLRKLRHNILPACSHLAQVKTDVVVLTDPETTCRDCPLTRKYAAVYHITTRLEHSGTIYGYLSVSTPVDYALDEEEQSLIREIAGDIAFGLYKIELEKKREQAEQKLQESFEYQKSIFETTSVATIIIEEDTTLGMVNKEFEKLSGYPKEDLEGKISWIKFVPQDDIERMKEYHQQRRIDPDTTIKQYESRFINKVGEIRNILVNVDLIPGTKRSVASLLDITSRKRAEQLLSALNQAAVSIGTTNSLDEIFTIVSNQLGKLNLACMLFPIDESQKKLKTKYMNIDSAALNKAETMMGKKHEDFSFSIDAFDDYKQAIREKKTAYQENITASVHKILPAPFKKLALPISRILNLPKAIVAPLTVRDDILGVFLVLSNDLSEEDVPAITAFANQLAAAWYKTELIQNLEASLKELDQSQEALEANLIKLQKSLDGTINAMTSMVEKRDPYTAGHQTRVTKLAIAIANELHLSADQIMAIQTSGLVHDIGKINVPSEILSKPGKLTLNEFRLLKSHPKHGFDILKKIDFPWPVGEIVYQHHERIDGTGYPRHLKGDKICIEAKILAVADVVEAMLSHRPYRAALSLEETMREIIKNKESLYDGKVVNACEKLFKTGKFIF